MKILVPISKKLLNRWKIQEYNEKTLYKNIMYIKSLAVDDGVLLYNTMTNELILISESEYNDFMNNKLKETNFFLYNFLVSHWFMIPAEYNEKMMVYLHRNMNKNKSLVGRYINTFTILTTTDCNARCYYCFELGAKRTHMTKQTAEDVAKFIIHKANPNKTVRISWFGGEPLYNAEVMDIISKHVTDNGLRLWTTMVSNGYLFDDELVNKAATIWNLRQVQITLDGTEDIYNKTKAYIYRNTDSSPFQVVLNNIERLIKSNIKVNIRFNLSEKNYKDLYKLVDIIDERFFEFKNTNKFSIYISLLYENLENNPINHTDEQRKFIYGEYVKLMEYCKEKGLLFTHYNLYRDDNDIRCQSCMADSCHNVLISPEGNLGKCEHYVDSDFYGSIYDESVLDRNYNSLREWKELREEKSDCNTCFFYPKCYRLKGCISSLSPNSDESCIKLYSEVERYMYNAYYDYKLKGENHGTN